MKSLLSLITVFNLILYIFVAIKVIRYWHTSKAHRRFFLVLTFGFLWILVSLLLYNSPEKFWSILAHTNYAIAAFIAAIISSFSIHFPKENKSFSFSKEAIFYSPALVLAILSFTNLVVLPGAGRSLKPAPLYVVYISVLAIYFIVISFSALISKLVSSKGVAKQQLQYYLFGYSIAIFAQLGQSIYLNTHLSISDTIALVILNFTTLFIVVASYSIIKYRFLDIRIAIQRGIARLLTFGIIFGFFAYLLLFIERNVEATSERNVSLLIVVVVLVLTVEPLRRWIYRFVDGLFDNQERKRRDALQRIQLVASSTLQFTSLVERLSSELRSVFGVDVHFLLRDEQHGKLAGTTELSLKDPIAGQIVDGKVIITDELPYRVENGEAMLAPLHTWLLQNKVSAVLPIGNREDFVGAFLFHDAQGSVPFTTDRVEFLKRFSNQVQFAFASAYAYKLAVERISV